MPRGCPRGCPGDAPGDAPPGMPRGCPRGCPPGDALGMPPGMPRASCRLCGAPCRGAPKNSSGHFMGRFGRNPKGKTSVKVVCTSTPGAEAAPVTRSRQRHSNAHREACASAERWFHNLHISKRHPSKHVEDCMIPFGWTQTVRQRGSSLCLSLPKTPTKEWMSYKAGERESESER